MNLEIPESTVRCLRDKYNKQMEEEATGGFSIGPRGRPLRLGKYDSDVIECLRELKRSGEKVNAFVAIATARQVSYKCTLFCNFDSSLKLRLMRVLGSAAEGSRLAE